MKKLLYLFSVTFILSTTCMDPESEINEKKFLKAVQDSDITTLKNMVAAGMSPDTSDKDNNTALMIAVKNQNIPIAQELLRLGAHTDTWNRNGQSPFTLAITTKNLPMLQLLLHNSPYINIAQKDIDGNTLLMLAVQTENIPIIEEILNLVPDPSLRNKQDKSARWFAHAISNEDIKKKILKLLTRAEYQFKLYQEISYVDASIPHIEELFPDVLLNIPSIERSPLGIAIDRQKLNIIDLLITHGADINQKLERGLTPLMIAIQQANKGGIAPEIINFLLSKGANPFITNAQGETAFDIAKKELNDTSWEPTKEVYKQIITTLEEKIPDQLLFSLQNFIQKLNVLLKSL